MSQGETNCLDFATSMEMAELIRKYDPRVDTIILTSEDRRFVEARHKYANAQNWRFVVNPIDVMQGSGDNSEMSERHDMDSVFISFYTSLRMQVGIDYACTLIGVLRFRNRAKALSSFVSLFLLPPDAREILYIELPFELPSSSKNTSERRRMFVCRKACHYLHGQKARPFQDMSWVKERYVCCVHGPKKCQQCPCSLFTGMIGVDK